MDKSESTAARWRNDWGLWLMWTAATCVGPLAVTLFPTVQRLLWGPGAWDTTLSPYWAAVKVPVMLLLSGAAQHFVLRFFLHREKLVLAHASWHDHRHPDRSLVSTSARTDGFCAWFFEFYETSEMEFGQDHPASTRTLNRRQLAERRQAGDAAAFSGLTSHAGTAILKRRFGRACFGQMGEKKLPGAIAPELMDKYRSTARARQRDHDAETDRYRKMAWTSAREAARVLKEGFGATRVIAFGSLAHGAWFGSRSDIDLAVEGVPPDAFWRAWCALDRLRTGVEIDLVAIESAPSTLRAEIEQGVAL